MDDSDRLSALRQELRRRLGDERYDLWLGPQTSLALDGNKLRVACASQAEAQWLRRNLQTPLAASASAAWGEAPSVSFSFTAPADAETIGLPAAVRGGANPELTTSKKPQAAAGQSTAQQTQAAAASTPERSPSVGDRPIKRPRWTFEDFVVGPSNSLAVGAAREAAERWGRFSPLLVYGPTGTGKSHLLSGVVHQVRASRQRLRVMQLTAEQFTSQFLAALEQRALPGFRQKSRQLDVLIVDDVHFLANKKATLEELIYTLDAVHGRGGQVVLSSDRPLSELQSLSAELASRISAGLSVALDPPDYAVRLGIVRAIAQRLQIPMDDGVAELIAQQVVGSGRLLSGAVNRLVATSMAARKPIDADLAGEAIADFCRQHAPQVRLADIQRAVCDVFGVEATNLKSSRKCRSIAEPRMLAMWLARRYTRAALSEIGDFFGRRSHSTVVSAQRKFDQLISRRGEIVVGDQLCQVEEAVRRIEAKLRTA